MKAGEEGGQVWSREQRRVGIAVEMGCIPCPWFRNRRWERAFQRLRENGLRARRGASTRCRIQRKLGYMSFWKAKNTGADLYIVLREVEGRQLECGRVHAAS